MTTVELDRGTARKISGAISPEHDHHGFALHTLCSDPVAMAFAAMGRRPHFDDGGPVDPDDQVRTGPGYTPGPYQPTPATDAAGTADNQNWGSAILQAGMGVANGIGSAVTLPRDVMQGSVDPMSDEGIQRATNLATMLPGAGMPMAEAGALGSAGGAMSTADLAGLWDFDEAPGFNASFDAKYEAATSEPAQVSAAELQSRTDGLNPNNLPMDEASRLGRARDLGFDTSTPLYHGTPNTWEGTGFRGVDDLSSERGIFLTPDPDVAHRYAGAYNSTNGSVLPVYARIKNPMVVDMQGEIFTSENMHNAIEAARNGGHDALIAHNMLDLSHSDLYEAPQTQVAVFHPSNIRSAFATFDPAAESGSDLLSARGLGVTPDSSSDDGAAYGQPPVTGADGITRGSFARGGPVDHDMAPDAQARALLQRNGVDHPAIAAVHHLSRSIANHDPVRIALALAQADHAVQNGYALQPAEASQDLHHMAVQRGAFAQGGGIAGLPAYGMHPSVAAAFAAMNQRPHFDDGGSPTAGTPVPSPAPTPGGGSPVLSPAPIPGGDGSGSGLPLAGRDPSGLLQNGTDTGAIARFWGGQPSTSLPSPAWSDQRAGLPAPVNTRAPTPGPSPAGPSTVMPAAQGTAPLYNPMADPAVRNSLHLARGGPITHPAVARALAAMGRRPHFDDGGDAGGGDGSHSSGGDGSSSGGDSGAAGGGDASSSGGNGDAGAGASSTASSSGGQSDAATGGAGAGGGIGGSVGAPSSGGQSDAASGGADTSAAPAAANASSGVEGAAGLGLAAAASAPSATSGPVGSIAGSVGAPAAGGFSSEGAPATGGFGSFGATPASTSNLAGMTSATPTASSLSGQSAAQSMASQAASAGDPGEDGTGAAGFGASPTAGQAFSSFGPSPASPYGSTANAQGEFGGTQAGDLAGSSLSPMGQQLGAMGLGAMPSGLAQNPAGFASPGAYGLSTTTGGLTPGFDNFSSMGNLATSQGVVQSSSLGATGYTGADTDSPNEPTSTLQGDLPGSVVNAMYGGLPGADSMAQDAANLDTGFTPDYSGTNFGPDGKLSVAGNVGQVGEVASGLAGLGGAFGSTSGAGLGSQPTGTAPGVNADGDPTAVGGLSALTVHGNQTEAAQGGYDAPGPATAYGGITDQQAFDARQNIVSGVGTAADQAIASGYVAQQNSPVGPTVGLNNVAASVGVGAPSASANQDAAVAGPPATPAQNTEVASTTPGVPNGAYSAGMHAIEGGVLNGQVDPNNPSHYGPAQFSQQTWNGVRTNNPGLGLPASMFAATAEQYAGATQALTQENAAALQKAGLPATPANLYMLHNLGAPVGIAAITAGPNATLAEAGISASVQAANPSIYGGAQTIGQVQAHVASLLERGAAGASTTSPDGLPASVQRGPANYSPGAASGMDTTDTSATTTNPGISPPSTWSPGVATPATTQTISTPAPYGVSATTATTLGAFGMNTTPANAMAAETLGFGVASQVMNGAPNDPVEAAGISDAAMAANPSLFAGVKTIGDLQANITKAAETAGATTSTVTTPGTPAGLGALPGYSYSPGAASGLDSVDSVAASLGISAPGVYGTPAQGVPNTSTTTPSDATDTDAPTPSPLTVNPKVSNFAINAALAGLGGPFGAVAAGINGVSGLLGGPTLGGGLNSLLGSIGSGSGSAGYSPGGQGDNSSQPGQSGAGGQLVLPGDPAAGAG